ncbi:MAG TPA: hypothetical protein EYP60_05795 [bacterium (Candidatus Stahlbacteria)]|nr:hypothetical protein [Candidatus Stahlbacteria bacterium]
MRYRSALRRWSFLLSLLVVSLLTQNGHALMVKIPLAQLTKEANYIVIGKVKDMHSEWNADRTLIYTYVTISIKECIKGTLNKKTITVRHIGGIVDNIGMWQSDTPQFSKNQEVMLFLKPTGKKIFMVAGRFQGKYTIKNDRILEKNIAVSNFVKQIKKIIQRDEKK